MEPTCPLAERACTDLISSVDAAMAEVDRLKQDLISTVNHELRTPLSAILGYCELLAEHDGLDPTARTMVEVVQRNSLRLVTLITDLLLLARLDADGPAQQREPVDLTALVAEVAARVQAPAAAAGLAVRVVLAGEPVTVVGERALLDRAINHLATNAVKFAAGGRTLTLTVWLESTVEHLRANGGASRTAVVEVADDGPGVELGELATLTERFVRADLAQRDQVPGAGLGLSVVASVVAHHGGRLDLESAAGQGVTARIRLPMDGASRQAGQ